MSKTQSLIKSTFNDYFERLEDIAKQVTRLKAMANQVTDPDLHDQIVDLIHELECDIDRYAEELEKDGMELLSVAA